MSAVLICIEWTLSHNDDDDDDDNTVKPCEIPRPLMALTGTTVKKVKVKVEHLL